MPKFHQARFVARSVTVALAIMCATWLTACSAAQTKGVQSSDNEPNNPCGPGGTPWKNPYPVVAQTVYPDGWIIDWIPINSQLRDGETMPSPPPPPPALPAGAAVSNPAETLHQQPGPPGTVPMPHPRVLTCECKPGYTTQPGLPCVPLGEQCSHEGGTASAKNYTQCCPGLEMIRDSRLKDGTCFDFGLDYGICARCGDGQCGLGETICNCSRDCPK